MLQIRLVSDEHDDDARVCMVTQLLEPPLDTLVGLVLRNIVHQQRPHCAAVIRARDGAVALLPRRVPNLGFDGLVVDFERARGKLDANGRLAVHRELVAGESGEQVALADARVANQHH